jgi:hypothetical protein
MFHRILSRSASRSGGGDLDAPGSSLHAIERKRAATKGELMAHVYRHAARQFLVTSIMHVPGSVILECGEPSVLPFDVSDDELGRAVCEHLLRHEAREPPNLRNMKLTDWPVFKASRERSVSGFEAKSSIVTVETKGGVLVLEAAPVRSLQSGVSVKGNVRPFHQELGGMIRMTLRGADALRQAGIV